MTMETLKYSLTYSAANTFTEFEKSLDQEVGQKRKGRRGNSTKVMMIRAITVEWLAFDDDPSAGDCQEIQITTNSESAMVNISDKDLFWKAKLYMDQTVAATEGHGIAPVNKVQRYIVNLPYIKKEMYIGIDANAVAASSGSLHIQIEFQYKYVNDWQLARIISRKA